MKLFGKGLALLAAFGFAVMLFGCSGGGGGTLFPIASKSTSVKVTGTAAKGGPIANAQVTVVDKNGKSASTTTGSDGSFSLDTAGMSLPFLVQVASLASGTYYSISADANSTTTINITPLTDMIIRAWYDAQGSSVESAFSNPAGNPPPSPAEVSVISAMVESVMNGWMQQAGINTSDFNLISTPFSADGSGVDKILDMTVADSVAGSLIISDGTITQVSTLGTGTASSSPSFKLLAVGTPAGSLNMVSTSTTTFAGTSSPLTVSTTVPTNDAQAAALNDIDAAVTAFAATVNQMGSSLSASDIAPYVDPNFLDNGLNASQWESKVAKNFAGTTVSFSGIQINALDATNGVADVSFVFSRFQNNVTESTTVRKLFRLINGSWLISGNNQIANAYASTWAWSNQYIPPKNIRFEVDDPSTNVMSVTVSGPVLSSSPSTTDVPMVCDQGMMNGLPQCGTSYGSGAKRAFQLDIPDYWPTLPATFTFSLTDSSSAVHNYSYTVSNGFGYDSSGTRVNADFPVLTATSPSKPTLADIIGGITVHGSIFVPLFVTDVENAPHFNYEGVGGSTNNITNQLIYATWDNTIAIAGQINNFTITIPAATILSPSTNCAAIIAGGGKCQTITFQGFTGDVQGGWFGEDACYSSTGNEPESCTNNGVEIQ